MNLTKTKRTTLICMMIGMLGLTGCCLQHDWADATCTEPQTCTKCGETQGEALGHQWTEATCTEPKTCSVCGETEGEALGHEWIEATFDAPQTCSICGATVGEKYDFTVTERAYDSDLRKMWIDSAEEYMESTLKSEMVDKDRRVVAAYLSDDGDLENIDVEFSEEYVKNSYSVYPTKDYVYVEIVYGLVVTDDNVDLVCSSSITGVCCLNYDGEVQSGAALYVGCRPITTNEGIYFCGFDASLHEVEVYDNTLQKTASCTVDTGLTGIWENCSDPSNPVIFLGNYNQENMFDCNTFYDLNLNQIDGSDTEEELAGYFSLRDSGNWTSVNFCYGSDGVYFVGNDDEWGYVDRDGNELAMYKDATNFNTDGYALVSDDGESYSVIDKNFEIVKENVIEGNSVSYNSGDTFYVTRGEEYSIATIEVTGGPGEEEE